MGFRARQENQRRAESNGRIERVQQLAKARTSLRLRGIVYYAWRDSEVYKGGKDFWERVCLITSKDQNLTKAREVAVAAARSKIEALKGAINDLRMKTAMAEMNEMAAGMVSNIGGSGDTLNRLHEMVEEERTKAAGRARMARDSMDMSEVNLKEAEMDALADQALADFAAKEGISLPGQEASETPAASRSMGGGNPQSESQ